MQVRQLIICGHARAFGGGRAPETETSGDHERLLHLNDRTTAAMTKHARRIVIFLASIVVSFLSHYFLNGWINIIPWAIVTLCVGYTSNGRRNTVVNGAIFGYFLFLVYILIGYGGKTDTTSIATIILFALVFSLIGSVAGVGGALIGNIAHQRINPPHNSEKVK